MTMEAINRISDHIAQLSISWKKFEEFLLCAKCLNTEFLPASTFHFRTEYGNLLFFLSGFSSQTLTIHRIAGEERGSSFYSTLPLPPTHEHWDIYLQLCMWDDYHVFLIATLVFTRLLLDEIYHLIELPFEWLIDDAMFVCLFDELILGFCYSDLTLKTGGFELASTITLVLQANWLTKCACHSRKFLYSAQLQENMDQKKLRIWLFYTQLKLRSSGQALVTPTLQILELTFWLSTQVLFSSTIMKLLKRNLLSSFN